MATEQSVMAVIRAARPQFRTAFDKAAFAVHSAFVAAGYVLHATGPPAFADDALSISYSDEVGMDNWNALEDNYGFVYSNPEKDSKKVLLKCLEMNDKLLADILKEGGSEPLHLEIDVGEYVQEGGGTNYGSHYKNLGKLVESVNKGVLNKLDGASSSSTKSSSKEASSEVEIERPWISPDYQEDPYAPAHPGYIVPPVPGFGGSDLLPGGGAGIYPSRGDFGGGSMLVGPGDPRFFGGPTRDPGLPGLGPTRGPPGSRFDPIGPPDVPGFEPGRFVRNPRRPGGGFHPDLQHFNDGSDFI